MFKKLGEGMYFKFAICGFMSSDMSIGSYNKVFALNFDNRVEAIARIPTTLAGAPFFTSASEVATLEFVREVLGIRAPRVFAWSADATANSVGTEYIIMEKMSGVESHHRWTHIAKAPEVFPLLDGVFNIESSFEGAPFSQIGSLYFKDDVRTDLRDRPLFHPGSLPEYDIELHRRLDAAKDKYRVGIKLAQSQIVNGGGRNEPK